jgi:hypothetical protein
MTPKQKVRERYPDAFRAPFPVAGVWDIITPSRRPSPGYKSHRALGAGTTPGSAWADAAQRILRRGHKRTAVGKTELHK